MKQLARIGGTDIKSITFNILRRIMSDSVGSMFSYVGAKKNIHSLIYISEKLYLVNINLKHIIFNL